MKQCILAGLFLASICVSSTWAWGGLFNRFNPSLMNDMYGSSYGKELYKAAETRPSAQMNNLAELLEEEYHKFWRRGRHHSSCRSNYHNIGVRHQPQPRACASNGLYKQARCRGRRHKHR